MGDLLIFWFSFQLYFHKLGEPQSKDLLIIEVSRRFIGSLFFSSGQIS
jgi:hypothetical protein